MDSAIKIFGILASLAWPAFAFVVLFLFRSEISEAIGRFRKGKVFGQEIELGERLTKLQRSTVAATEEVAEAVQGQSPEAKALQAGSLKGDPAEKVLEEATRSPSLALMLLSAELDKAARHGLAVRGLLKDRRHVPVSVAVAELQQYGFPPNLLGSLKLFGDVRNRIIHGGSAGEEDILRAIDSGITLLNALNAMPAEDISVYHPGVDVFADQGLVQICPGVRGLILQAISPGGAIKSYRIYPTTRTHYRKGKRVAWEWNDKLVCKAAWYRDPDTGEIKQAWVESMEFIGRHLEDI